MINELIDKKNLLNNKEYLNKLNDLRKRINRNSSQANQEITKLGKSLNLSVELVKLIECLKENKNIFDLTSDDQNCNAKVDDKIEEMSPSENTKPSDDMKSNQKSTKKSSNEKFKQKIEINQDDNPIINTKHPINNVEYIQELFIRYLKPTTPKSPGEIIINQLPDEGIVLFFNNYKLYI
jgi:hypothetical protein